MKYMLDTNVLVHLIRNKSENVKNRLRQENISDVCISSITYAELEYGVSKSSNKEKNALALLTVLSGIKVLPLGESAGKVYGSIRASLEKDGNVIGPNDMLIAAHALAEGLTLVTNNTREFGRVPGLNIEDWTDLV